MLVLTRWPCDTRGLLYIGICFFLLDGVLVTCAVRMFLWLLIRVIDWLGECE